MGRCDFRTLVGYVALLVAAAGCGSQKALDLPLGTVTGTVTLEGKPLPNALVMFTPAVEGGKTSVGVTNAAGHYTLAYTRDTPGANVGRHEVHVSTAAVDGNAKERVPPKYTGGNGLSAEVRVGENVIDLDL